MESNLYRKYRPINFDQVVGQDVVVQTLKNSIKNKNIAHAYLFAGVRGTGKTSIAKIFAKAVNCQNIENPLCGECEMCQEFASGADIPDIFEIDAASNNGVDEIRRIIENVKYLPIRTKHKIYIIDEVHMLSKGAFNALLKTLEEPPHHVVFILATTEPNKIPVTILSRVQRFDFSRIDDEDILAHLIKILKLEQIDYEEEALKLIVRHAQGGLRDALSLLTKVIAYDANVTENNVRISLSLSSKNTTEDLLSSIINNNPVEVSGKYKQIIKSGVDETYLIQDLIDISKEKLLLTLEAETEESTKYISIITKLMETVYKLKTISNSVMYTEVILIELSIEKPKEIKDKVIEVKDQITEISEEEKISKLKKQANLLATPTVEIKQEIDEVESKPVEKISNENSTFEYEQENLEDNSSNYDEVVNVEESISKVDTVDIDNITVIDTLKNATKEAKQQALKVAKDACNELNEQKKYGIAKFFEVSSIQGASVDGIVLSVDQNFYASYEPRIDLITQIYSNKLGNQVKIHLLTNQYWKQNRMNFVRVVKENREVDIYKEATNFFGKDMVTKVNT